MTDINHPKKIEQHLPINLAAASAVPLLVEASGLSRRQIKIAMQKGAVWHSRAGNTRRLRRAKRELKSGDELHLYYDEKILSMQPPTPQLVADQGGYSVWYKPYGMLSQGSKWGDHCTINRWVETHLQPQRPAFVVHRLDRAATGLILIAHSKSSAAGLSELFHGRRVDKRYEVGVKGCFPHNALPFIITTEIDGRPATTQVLAVEYDEELDCSLLRVKIETGRKHQIRKHLAEQGYPVIGDRLYGEVDAEQAENNLQLCCYQLGFQCPISHQQRCFQLAQQLRFS